VVGHATVGRVLQLQREAGHEVAQGGQQAARIGFGPGHEARELGQGQVVELAVTLQVQMRLQVFAGGIGAAHLDGERVALARADAVLLFVAGVLGGLFGLHDLGAIVGRAAGLVLCGL
jgi:hypothetical protein